MNNLGSKIKIVTILGEEYPIAYSNSSKENARKMLNVESIKKGEKEFTLEQAEKIVMVMINDGIKLSNFIKKESVPYITEEEISILIDYSSEDELSELFTQMTEFIKQSN